MAKKIITVTPNPALDRSAILEKIVPGELHRLENVTLRAGGKGINTARAARKAGAPVLAAALSAGAGGEMLRHLLEGEGLPHELIPADGETRINLKINAGGVSTEFNEPGPAASPDTLAAFCELLRRNVSRGDTAAFCGSLPPGFPPDGYAELIRTARSLGAFTALDADGDALRLALSACPDLIKPNAAELAALFGEKNADSGRLKLLASRVISEGHAKAILCSLGAEGAFYMSASDYAEADAIKPQRIVTTVGAGDTLLGSFLAAVLRGLDPSTALSEALYAAAHHISGGR